jgi:hypothetical protein
LEETVTFQKVSASFNSKVHSEVQNSAEVELNAPELATEAPIIELPLFYRALEPLNSQQHGDMKIRRTESAPQMGSTHAVPITVDEFALLQRHYPIVFSVGGDPVPLALMGLNEGSNVFLDQTGLPHDPSVYIPAYLRRYPFLLARLRPHSDELSLCFDPTSGAIGEFDAGEPLFDGGQPSEATKAVLAFCEQFETAGQRTSAFIQELKTSDLLMDGEVAIQPEGASQPFVYRGFRMVDEEKLREIRGKELCKLNQSGMLAIIYAHLFSLSQIREVFSKQIEQGKGPFSAPGATTNEACIETDE